MLEVLDHEYFMGLSLREADRAMACEEVPVGAVLVGLDGVVWAHGHNLTVTQRDATAHAEIVALRRASALLRNARLSGTVLYVTLEPCPMCLGALIQARVDGVVFGAFDPKAGAAGSVVDLTRPRCFHHSVAVLGGVRRDECAQRLARFFQDRRKPVHRRCGEVPKWS
ncbi:tRNA adenosine(34) deaminase TadA [Desulfosoma caldarium]|uniref:tRNA adenosine(34) deaminase TadA n=1 Tax=Desulfosoma caldarium TaxID=610254 RepID=UPI001B87BBC0|nr:tRNA adenosine(34) deaminase TadA [Desulfosoma caldarium]